MIMLMYLLDVLHLWCLSLVLNISAPTGHRDRYLWNITLAIPFLLTLHLTSTLRKKCPYLRFFWSVFFRIRTEYGEILSTFQYSVRMREYTEKKNSGYGHFSRIDLELLQAPYSCSRRIVWVCLTIFKGRRLKC